MSAFTNLLQFITHPAARRFLREKTASQLEVIYQIACGDSKNPHKGSNRSERL
jgi:hypothetical protein